MEDLMLLTITDGNIIIKQNQIDALLDEIEYHELMIRRHYDCSVQTAQRYLYNLKYLNKLRLEQKAYKLAKNLLKGND